MATFTTYAAWYNLPENDPFAGDYTTLFPNFSLPALPGVTDIRLTNTIATGNDAKTALAFLGDDGTIHLLHRIRRYIPALGAAPAPYDNDDFATFDDASMAGPTTVALPVNSLYPCQGATTATAAAINTYLTAHPGTAQIAPDPAADPADVNLARGRRCMVVPPNLVGPILAAASSPTGLTPGALWTQFAAPLVADPLLSVTCAPFIDWARIAFSHGVAAINPLAIAIPPPRHLAASLGAHRHQLYRSDFPIAAAPVLDPLVLALTQGQQAAADRDHARILLEQQNKAAAALPSKRWGTGLTRLLRLCQVDTQQTLPPVWRDMASHGMKSDATTIRSHLLTPIPELGPCGLVDPPVCSMDMARFLGRLEFQTHPDAIEAGLHVFGVCHPTQEAVAKANEIVGIYTEQVLGSTGLTVTESLALKKSQKLLLPTNLSELRFVIMGYVRFLAVTLGHVHPVVQNLRLLSDRLGAEEMRFYLHFCRTHPDRNPLTTGVLMAIHTRMYNWIESQTATDMIVPPPEFATILVRITEREWLPPALPDSYLAAPYAAALKRNNTGAPNLQVNNNIATPNAGIPKVNHRDHDLYFDVDLSLRDPAVRQMGHFVIKTFLQQHGPPPSNADNQPMCLSFHVRHRCRSDCARLTDHRKHTPAETTTLNTYLSSAAIAAP